jgi:hypothetical protein
MHIVSHDFASMSMLVSPFYAQFSGLGIYALPALWTGFYHRHDGIFRRLPVEGTLMMILFLPPVWHSV